MNYVFNDIVISASKEKEIFAAELFAEELEMRTGKAPVVVSKPEGECYIELKLVDESDSEDFHIEQDGKKITVTAHRLRSLIYGYSMLLRKSVVRDGELVLTKDISGDYSPYMPVRGHQLSYTDMNNTYEAWDEKQYERYIRELMMFGMNTVEGCLGKDEKPTKLMKYSFEEITKLKSAICQRLDIDFSMWSPFTSKRSDDDSAEYLVETCKDIPEFNIFFPPGGDPGDLQAEDFFKRCKTVKRELNKHFPDMELWPSAQAPHEYDDWGDRFIKEMAKLPEEIDGVVYGPNHPFTLDTMRRSIDLKYPIRYYPDVGHNVRCEIPVHFDREDWHYAYASTLSREAVNPRPSEYRLVHRLTKQYVCGSVSYSEGVNDDVNKFVFGALDFDPDSELREILRDYARSFFPETDTEKMVDVIFGLEQNWNGDPTENSSVDNVFNTLMQMKTERLEENWRFVILLFRASCDKIVRDRRIFELDLIDDAKTQIRKGKLEKAKEILSTDFSAEYKELRGSLFPLAESLFKLIGMQLDVEHFGGMGVERGCTLDTIDMPVTDRQYLLNKLEQHPDREYMTDIIDRNKVAKDEYYFSFAEQGFEVAGKQKGEFYMNFRGDDNADAALPMCMTKVYDHFNFDCKVAGLTGGDYELRVTYKSRPNDKIIHHKVTVNGNVVHDGAQFGGRRDEEYEKKYLAGGYQSIVYDIPKEYLQNGCADLEITEPLDGFMISEFRFTKKR